MFNSFDNSELNRYPIGYGIVDNSSVPMTLASCGENFPIPNGYITLSNPRRNSVMPFDSTPRGPNGVTPMSLGEHSAGVMSTKDNRIINHDGSMNIESRNSSSNNNDTYINQFPSSVISPSMSTSTSSSTSPSLSSSSSSSSSQSSAENCTVNNNSSPSLLFSTSSGPSSLPIFEPVIPIGTNTSVISTATGSSPSSMDYVMTNRNYILVHHDQQQQQQQQQYRQQLQQQQQQQLRLQRSSFVPYSPNEFQGVTCSTNHPSVYEHTQYTPWNGIAQANEVHSTTDSIPTSAASIAWVDNAANNPNITQVHCTTTTNDNDSPPYVQGQSHIQRPPDQAKSQQLQVMTSLEPNFTPMYPQTTGNVIDIPHNVIQSPAVTPAQHYHWGVALSPVESSFNSGPSSRSSSRPTSPSFNQSGPSEGHSSEPHLCKQELESPSQTIRSRKSSISSTSSTVSQRRMSALRESITSPTSPSPNSTLNVTSTTTPNNQCVACGQCFAGPAVLIRHVESIHEKLLWNCVGCKSNLSRRDAVTRHINLSPMDSICRAVGTIGQIKMVNGNEIQYEVSSYRAKPYDEVVSRMKKAPTASKRDVDLAKTRDEGGDPSFGNVTKFEDDALGPLDEDENEDAGIQVKQEELSEENEDEAGQKKRRRPSLHTFARKK
ncbi:hypothetical protein BGX20_001993 [Mortierella sp. AD010]|nr:hypothetical protein BGX20_001993 [Mortierella sp. AD010]